MIEKIVSSLECVTFGHLVNVAIGKSIGSFHVDSFRRPDMAHHAELRKVDMSHRTHVRKNNHRQIRCPHCGYSTNVEEDRKLTRPKEILFLLGPEQGDLTQCPGCNTMLEYVGELGHLSLRRASRERIVAFNKLCREGQRAPTLAELVDYVIRFRGMRNSDDPICGRQQKERQRPEGE